MGFLHHVLHLAVTEQNEGVYVFWRCPRCEQPRDFFLIRGEGNFSLVGLQWTGPETLMDLRCAGCGYELKVSPTEASLLEEARSATLLLKGGALSQEAYVKTLKALNAKFMADLVALTESFKCDSCGENNPASFDTCWNCGFKRRRAPTPISDDVLPSFPRGGNSWEAF